jgi:hypothetical protein
VWIIIASFGVYFCMYGFRKPFTAGSYVDDGYRHLEYKSLLILAQTLGYVCSKWLGIKFISEIKPEQRVKSLVVLVLLSEVALLFFGVVERPWNSIFLFLNGLALGLVFGFVLGYLEGRRHTEALIAILCASFIVSDGVAKSVGKWLILEGITERWMPFFSGLIFMLPFLFFCWMLGSVPPPSANEAIERKQRLPMDRRSRWEYFQKYAPGLTAIMASYLFVTILRSIRADFAPEIWQGLGFPQTPAIFTQSELLVSIGVIFVSGMVIFIKSHFKALITAIVTCILGFLILLGSVWGLQRGLDPFIFMVLTGLGVYIPYVSIHTAVFERMVSLTNERANIGFLMYVADSIGYTGYIALMFYRYFSSQPGNMLGQYIQWSYILGIGGLIFLFAVLIYFWNKFMKYGTAH